MENTGIKGLFVTLYQRVILSYKTTLFGIGVVAIGAVADYLATSPNKIVTIIASILGAVLMLIKEKYPAPPVGQ
jgi:uncharacterized membrane protein